MSATKRKVVRTCVVCGAPTKGVLLGVDACRACTSFFKRATIGGKQYICRQGSRNCAINNDGSAMCRRCRFDKCTAISMKLPRELEKNLENSNESMLCRNDGSVSRFCSEQGPSSVKDTSILETMQTAYRDSLERHKQYGYFLRSTVTYENVEMRTASGEIFYHCTNDFFIDSLPSMLMESLRMAMFVFPELSELSQSDRQAMLKVFAGTYNLLETNYLTEVYFPGNDRYVVSSHTTYVDMQQNDALLEGLDKNDYDRERIMLLYTKKTTEIIRPLFREAKLTETEFHATLCLAIWDIGHAAWLPTDIVKIGEAVMKRIIDDLGRYYKEVLKCDEYASRLGRLLSLVHTVREAASLMQEQYQQFKLLGIFKDDDLIMKVLF